MHFSLEYISKTFFDSLKFIKSKITRRFLFKAFPIFHLEFLSLMYITLIFILFLFGDLRNSISTVFSKFTYLEAVEYEGVRAIISFMFFAIFAVILYTILFSFSKSNILTKKGVDKGIINFLLFLSKIVVFIGSLFFFGICLLVNITSISELFNNGFGWNRIAIFIFTIYNLIYSLVLLFSLFFIPLNKKLIDNNINPFIMILFIIAILVSLLLFKFYLDLQWLNTISYMFILINLFINLYLSTRSKKYKSLSFSF